MMNIKNMNFQLQIEMKQMLLGRNEMTSLICLFFSRRRGERQTEFFNLILITIMVSYFPS